MSETSLKYDENLAGQGKLQLIEVDESFLQEIFNNDSAGVVGHIKMELAYEDMSRRQACLSTQTSTFKVKSSETSNLLMATSLQGPANGQIIYSTNSFIELTGTRRRDQ